MSPAIDWRMRPGFPGEGARGPGNWDSQGERRKAGPHSRPPRCLACEGTPPGARRLSAPPEWPASPHPGQPPGNAARPEPASSCRSPRLPRREILHLRKEELGETCFRGGNTRRVEEKDKGVQLGASGQEDPIGRVTLTLTQHLHAPAAL